MRNAAEDYKPEGWFGRSRLNVNMAMSSTIDNALHSIYQEIAGDIVFPMVSGTFKEYNHDFLQAKSSGYSSEEAQCIAIGEIVQLPGLADDFGPLDTDRSPTPPPTTENCGVSYVLIPDDFLGEAADFLKEPVWPEPTEEFQFSTADAEEAYAELEAEAAQKTKSPLTTPLPHLTTLKIWTTPVMTRATCPTKCSTTLSSETTSESRGTQTLKQCKKN